MDAKQWFVWRPSAVTGATLCSPSQAAQRNLHRQACSTSANQQNPGPLELLTPSPHVIPFLHLFCLFSSAASVLGIFTFVSPHAVSLVTVYCLRTLS